MGSDHLVAGHLGQPTDTVALEAKAKIPAAFWDELRYEKLIDPEVPVPG